MGWSFGSYFWDNIFQCFINLNTWYIHFYSRIFYKILQYIVSVRNLPLTLWHADIDYMNHWYLVVLYNVLSVFDYQKVLEWHGSLNLTPGRHGSFSGYSKKSDHWVINSIVTMDLRLLPCIHLLSIESSTGATA